MNVNKLIGSSFRMVMISMIYNNPPITISKLHKSLNSFFGKDVLNFKKYDYKNTYKHIKILEREGLVRLEQKKKEQGKPIYITPQKKLNEVKNAMNKMMEKLRWGEVLK